LFSVTSAVR